MNEEIVPGLLKIKTWLQESLLKIDEEKQRLTAFLDTIDALLEEKTSIEEKPTTKVALEEVKRVFNTELLNVLDFSQEGDTIIIKQKQFLERDIWLTINAKVDELNGRWISSGEESRWEITIGAS